MLFVFSGNLELTCLFPLPHLSLCFLSQIQQEKREKERLRTQQLAATFLKGAGGYHNLPLERYHNLSFGHIREL